MATHPHHQPAASRLQPTTAASWRHTWSHPLFPITSSHLFHQGCEKVSSPLRPNLKKLGKQQKSYDPLLRRICQALPRLLCCGLAAFLVHHQHGNLGTRPQGAAPRHWPATHHTCRGPTQGIGLPKLRNDKQTPHMYSIRKVLTSSACI